MCEPTNTHEHIMTKMIQIKDTMRLSKKKKIRMCSQDKTNKVK